MHGVIQVRIEDMQPAISIESWEQRPEPWFDAFVAAKGMRLLTYEQFRERVTGVFLSTTGLDDRELFVKMTTGRGEIAPPDFSIFRVIYLKTPNDSVIYIRNWNNKSGSEDVIKRQVESDKDTKYQGSWIHLKKVGDDFVLAVTTELVESGISKFPYSDPELLNRITIDEKMFWDNPEDKYISEILVE